MCLPRQEWDEDFLVALQHNICTLALSKDTPHVCFQPLDLADVALRDMAGWWSWLQGWGSG